MTLYLSCNDFREVGVIADCCPTCHQDEELGYRSMDIIEPPNKEWRYKWRRGESHILSRTCCVFYKSLTRQEWARAAVVARRRMK